MAAVRARALAIPARYWLGAIVLASIAIRVGLGHGVVAPWIMVDELVYSDLARSVAANGQFLVRGVPSHGYGFVYPLLIAPAWRLFGAIPDAYAAAKAINAVVMSLTAIPAYFLARRLLPSALALPAAALTVAVPAMLYTGMLMTENAFYPIFVTVALLLVATLERPTPLRQIGLLVLCGVAYETRAQAVALLAAVFTAPILLALIERRGLARGLRPFATLYGIVVGGGLLVLAALVASGRSPLSLLGAYRAAASSTYTVGGVLRFFLYHVAGLDLSVGILPFAALLAMWLAPRSLNPSARAFVAASASITVWLLAEVAAFASESFVNRIEERNMFYLAPLALIAVLGLATEGVVTRRRPVLLVAAGIAGVLPVFIPYASFIGTSAVSDTFSLMPWWWVQDHLIHLHTVRWAALGVGLAAAALFVLLPRRYALALPGLVALYFVATSVVVQYGRHGIRNTSVNDTYAATREPHPDWIDRTVGRDASVDIIWAGGPGGYPVWENEFFNRSVKRVYDYRDAQRPDPLPEVDVKRAADGKLVAPGRPVHAEYVLAPSTLDVGGKLVVTDQIGYSLYRVDGPVIVLSHVSGLYDGDTWSGAFVKYQRVQCTGGTLSVQLQSDPNLFTFTQAVTAVEGGARVGRAHIPPSGERWLTVPLSPSASGRCIVHFFVARTLVPAQVEPGATDTRRLGAHFLRFVYHP